MITFKAGDIFKDDAQYLVNPVNCVGVMGAGLAKEFKTKYPDSYNTYKEVCEKKQLIIGSMLITKDSASEKLIIMFPTKYHYSQSSNYYYIEKGLCSLREMLVEVGAKSVAIPALGCGLGGLNWRLVRDSILNLLGKIDCDIRVYEPYKEYKR